MKISSRRAFLKGTGATAAGAALGGLVTTSRPAGAQEPLSAYEKKYIGQMGTEAPAVMHMSDATRSAEVGAVYANRHVPEFAAFTWNFEPSSDPMRFKEAIKPLSKADAAFLASTNTDGLIVIKGDTIVHEHYAKGMHPTTKHAVYSAGKSWTSAYFHKVLLPAMNKTVDEVLPEYKGSFYGSQTIRAVADMRSPALFTEDFTDPKALIFVAGSAAGWDFKLLDMEQNGFLTKMKKDAKYKQGDWHYVSANTMVLGLLCAKLAGLHAYEAIRRFHQALGLEHISGTIANLHGQYSAEGGQYYTLRDFAKLPYAMANGGKIKNRTVLSNAYIEDVFSADGPKRAAWKASKYDAAYKVINWYSNQWYAVDKDIAVAVGSYGQFNVFNRKNKVVIAKFSTYPVGQDVKSAGRDLPWMIEKVKSSL